MKKKLTRIGNSRGVILDAALLNLLKIDDSTVLQVSIDGSSIVITPQPSDATSEIRNSKLRKIVREGLEKYSEVLEKLAKT